MATVVITGGTGMIGTALTKELLARGYRVIILTRELPREKPFSKNVSYALWDVHAQTVDKAALQKADYIVHLAGANVAGGRWTPKRKKEIIDSRTKSSALLVKGLKENPNNVKAVICASAIGWYGPDPTVPNPKPFVEKDPADAAFLGQTSRLWEQSIAPVTFLGKRLVILRTGIVLSNEGGAYAEFKKPLQYGTATILGNGRQVLSWIHIKDIVGLYLYAIEHERMEGVYNAVAPQPVTNKQLILAMAKARNKIYVPVHVPEIALKIALGEMSVEVLKSATVSSKKVEQEGYVFLFPNIETAVRNLSIT